MCGISGAIAPTQSSTSALNRTAIESIVAQQFNRGPDFQKVETVTSGAWDLTFGHNRLSIIDLHPESNQPMRDHTGRFVLVYNGEIYNYLELRAELERHGHRFITKSDSEVIIESFKAWGPEALSHFNGMFAFALYDTETRKFWLCRDRFGVKPLYFHATSDRLVFASAMGPLAKELGLKPNFDYLARGLSYYVYDAGLNDSAYEGLEAVRPGNYLEATLDGRELKLASHRYYDLSARVELRKKELADLSERELVKQTGELLLDAIRLRLRSDVPLAVSLSGGLDSSTVASFLSDLHPDINGFTFGHPDAPESEGPLVAELCRKRPIRAHYVWPETKEIIENFSRTLNAQDAPFAGGSILAQNFVYAAARKQGFKVVLGGQGGDEGYMGYRKYQLFHLRHLMREKNVPQAIAFILSLMPMFMAEVPSLKRYWRSRARYSSAAGLQTVVRFPAPARALEMGAAADGQEWRRQAVDVCTTSLPTLLRYEDRNSMDHSIESRLPFMDYRVIETGLALPTTLKLRRGFGKWALREIAEGKIPESIRVARFKKGFNVNEARWYREGLGAYLRAELDRSWPAIENYVAPEFRSSGTKTLFSDERLSSSSNAFAEAATLIWLGEKLK